jgi:hypothetical protein
MIRLNPNETILAVYHRHWFILFLNLFLIGFVGIIAIVAVFILRRYVSAFATYPLGNILLWIGVVALQGAWIAAFVKITDYWLDTWIVTNERIIDIEQKGLFKRDITEFKLNKVQDVSFEIKGIIPTLLVYGNLRITTAGFDRNCIFWTVPNPQQIKNTILKAYDEYAAMEKAEAKTTTTVETPTENI